MVERTEVIDQIDSGTNEFIEKIINKHNLIGNKSAEIKYRKVRSTRGEHDSDDVIVEILLKDKLIAMQYQRRTDANWTEVINVEI